MSTHAYIGRKPCGCVVALVVDEPRWKRDTAKTVARYVLDGYAVERLTVAEATAALRRCDCTPTQRQLAEVAS